MLLVQALIIYDKQTLNTFLNFHKIDHTYVHNFIKIQWLIKTLDDNHMQLINGVYIENNTLCACVRHNYIIIVFNNKSQPTVLHSVII